MNNIRICHFGDTHIDAAERSEKWERDPKDNNIPLRSKDFIRALDNVVDQCIKQDVDAVLFSGDAYITENPKNYYRDKFQKAIMKLANNHIKVIMIPGNHDLNGRDTNTSAISVWESINVPNIFVTHSPKLWTPEELGLDMYVIAIPWIISRNLQAHGEMTSDDSNMRITGMLQKLISQFIEKAESNGDHYPIILLAHAALEGSLFNDGKRVDNPCSEMYLPMSAATDPALSYTALGHIHKPQILNEDSYPPVVYPGSIESIDMTEAAYQHGFVIVDIDRNNHASTYFNVLETRKMFDIKVDLTEETTIMEDIEKALPGDDEIRDSIIKLTVSCPKDWIPYVDSTSLEKKLESAFHIVGNIPNFNYKNETRCRYFNPEKLAQMSDDDLFSAYLHSLTIQGQKNGIQEERISRLFALRDRIINPAIPENSISDEPQAENGDNQLCSCNMKLPQLE